ncbi:MAG: hypothetical protein E7270_06420 [Lachnospiraceae bacterium]|nr:hypothetical protein [Lachnospiraceae bacterium]
MSKINRVLFIAVCVCLINIRCAFAEENVISDTDVNYYSSEDLNSESEDSEMERPKSAKIIKYTRKYARTIKLKWKKIKNADGYCVYRSKEKDGRYRRVATTAENTYEDKVKATDTYYYKVRTYIENENKKIYSDYSSIIKVKSKVKNKKNKLRIVELREKLYTYKEMQNDLKLLKEKYPDYFTYKVAGKTYDGRNIYIICLGNKNADKKILAQSTIHGREYMNSAICMAQLEYYLNNWNAMYDEKFTYGDLFNRTCVYMMPMLNPDGVCISQFGANGIKNKELRNKLKGMSGISNYERWKANARGVDINRNFSNHWERTGTPGSSMYSGRKADSERETRIIKRIVNKYNFDFIISYHSMGNLVYWDIGQSGEIYTETYKLARKISKITGYPLGEQSEPEGLSYNWTILDKNIPEIIIENGYGVCPLPESEYKKTWKKNKDLITKLIR